MKHINYISIIIFILIALLNLSCSIIMDKKLIFSKNLPLGFIPVGISLNNNGDVLIYGNFIDKNHDNIIYIFQSKYIEEIILSYKNKPISINKILPIDNNNYYILFCNQEYESSIGIWKKSSNYIKIIELKNKPQDFIWLKTTNELIYISTNLKLYKFKDNHDIKIDDSIKYFDIISNNDYIAYNTSEINNSIDTIIVKDENGLSKDNTINHTGKYKIIGFKDNNLILYERSIKLNDTKIIMIKNKNEKTILKGDFFSAAVNDIFLAVIRCEILTHKQYEKYIVDLYKFY